MNGSMKRFLFAAVVSVVMAGTASATTEEMKLVSGATTIIIFDNGAGDLANGTNGLIAYNNPDLNGWNVNLTAGVSNSPGISPVGMDLSAIVSATGASDPLEIFLSDLNFDVPISFFDTTYSASVTGNASTSEIAWANDGNTIFGLGPSNVIGNVGPITSPGGVGILTGGPAAGGVPPYSLTLEEIINPGAGAVFLSTDGNITPGPEPSSIMLFGTGLLGLAVVFFQRKRLGLSNGPLADC